MPSVEKGRTGRAAVPARVVASARIALQVHPASESIERISQVQGSSAMQGARVSETMERGVKTAWGLPGARSTARPDSAPRRQRWQALALRLPGLLRALRQRSPTDPRRIRNPIPEGRVSLLATSQHQRNGVARTWTFC